MPLMLKIFNPCVSIGLAHLAKTKKIATDGTAKFVYLFSKLWNVVNTKDKFLHTRLRDSSRRPIYSMLDDNVIFVKKVISWLDQWKLLNLPIHQGVLTRETMSALSHTLKTLIAMCEHFLEQKNYQFVLLGKFQTDPLEHRFSRYRSLSGSNYHISVQEILNSEKKLKAISCMKMLSNNNDVTLTDVTTELDKVQIDDKIKMVNEHEQFDNIDCVSIKLEDTVVKGFTAIAGFATHNNLNLFESCIGC